MGKQLLFSRVRGSLWPHGLQHTMLPCHSLFPRVCSDSCPLIQWCHPTISSSAALFSFCPQSLPASGYFPMSWLFALGGQSIEASGSASFFPVNIRGWFPLELTSLISLLSKGLSRVFSNILIPRHQFFGTHPSLWSSSHWEDKVFMNIFHFIEVLPWGSFAPKVVEFSVLPHCSQCSILLGQSCFTSCFLSWSHSGSPGAVLAGIDGPAPVQLSCMVPITRTGWPSRWVSCPLPSTPWGMPKHTAEGVWLLSGQPGNVLHRIWDLKESGASLAEILSWEGEFYEIPLVLATISLTSMDYDPRRALVVDSSGWRRINSAAALKSLTVCWWRMINKQMTKI